MPRALRSDQAGVIYHAFAVRESGGRTTQVATHGPTSRQTPKEQAVKNVATGNNCEGTFSKTAQLCWRVHSRSPLRGVTALKTARRAEPEAFTFFAERRATIHRRSMQKLAGTLTKTENQG